MERINELWNVQLAFHTQLELPPGPYQIRLGARDNRTGFLGATGMPLCLNSD